jgi:hypothetical protein
MHIQKEIKLASFVGEERVGSGNSLIPGATYFVLHQSWQID